MKDGSIEDSDVGPDWLLAPLRSADLLSQRSRRFMSDVQTELRQRGRTHQLAKSRLTVLFMAVLILLGFDYGMALVLFTEIFRWAEHATLPASVVALTVPIAMLCAHALIADQQEIVRRWIRRYAILGVLIIPIAISAGLGLTLADVNADDGSDAVIVIGQQIYDPGGVPENLGLAGLVLGVVQEFSGLLIFAGFTFALGVSFYLASYLIDRIRGALAQIADTPADRLEKAERVAQEIIEADGELQQTIHDGDVYHQVVTQRVVDLFTQKLSEAAITALLTQSERVASTPVSAGRDPLQQALHDTTDPLPHGLSKDEAKAVLDRLGQTLHPDAIRALIAPHNQ